jgi:hypothetical protein
VGAALPPSSVPPAVRTELESRMLEYMRTDAMHDRVCAVDDMLHAADHVTWWLVRGDVKPGGPHPLHAGLRRNMAAILSHNQTPVHDETLRQQFTNVELGAPLSDCWLSPRGVAHSEHAGGLLLAVCQRCETALRNQRMPRDAIANGNMVGMLPPELADATVAEHLLTSISRVQMSVTYLKGGGQRALSSHTVVNAHDPAPVARALPWSAADARKMCTVVLASATTSDQRARALRPFKVNVDRVLGLLHFLKAHHTAYRDVQIDADAIERMRQELRDGLIDGMAVELERTDEQVVRQGAISDEALAAAGLAYDADEAARQVPLGAGGAGRGAAAPHADGPDQLDAPADLPDVPMGAPADELGNPLLDVARVDLQHNVAEAAAAIGGPAWAALAKEAGVDHDEHALVARAQPTVRKQWEPEAMVKAWPHLFPFGKGGPGQRRVRMSSQEIVARLLLLSTRQFAQHQRFVLWAFDVINLARCSSKLFVSTGAAGADWSGNVTVTKDQLRAALDYKMRVDTARKSGHRVPPPPPPAVVGRALDLLNHADRGVGAMWGSAAERLEHRARQWAVINTLGPPTAMLTVSPRDVGTAAVLELAGLRPWLDPVLTADANRTDAARLAERWPSAAERYHAVNLDPVAAMRYFGRLVSGVLIAQGLQWSPEWRASSSRSGGLFGPLAAFYGMVEVQQRGCLHVHLLLWALPGVPTAPAPAPALALDAAAPAARVDDARVDDAAPAAVPAGVADGRAAAESYWGSVACASLAVQPADVADLLGATHRCPTTGQTHQYRLMPAEHPRRPSPLSQPAPTSAREPPTVVCADCDVIAPARPLALDVLAAYGADREPLHYCGGQDF